MGYYIAYNPVTKYYVNSFDSKTYYHILTKNVKKACRYYFVQSAQRLCDILNSYLRVNAWQVKCIDDKGRLL